MLTLLTACFRAEPHHLRYSTRRESEERIHTHTHTKKRQQAQTSQLAQTSHLRKSTPASLQSREAFLLKKLLARAQNCLRVAARDLGNARQLHAHLWPKAVDPRKRPHFAYRVLRTLHELPSLHHVDRVCEASCNGLCYATLAATCFQGNRSLTLLTA